MRTFPTAPVVGVGAVILNGSRVVLVQRGQAPLKGRWSLPGGVLELGETLEAAVAREILEETALEVVVGPVVGVIDRIDQSGDGRVEYHYVIVDYLCRALAEDVRAGSDVDDARWVELASVVEYGLTEQALAMIMKAVAMADGT